MKHCKKGKQDKFLNHSKGEYVHSFIHSLERNACSLLITWVLDLCRSKRNIYLGASRIIKKVAVIIFCCGFHLRYNRIFLILQSENQQPVTSTTPTTQIGLGLLLNGIRELPVYSISILRKIL